MFYLIISAIFVSLVYSLLPKDASIKNLATFWEKAARSVGYMFPLCFVY